MKIYCDTNVLIYASITQDEVKKAKAIDTLEQNDVVVSPLTLQEFIFAMSRLGMDRELIIGDLDYYSRFSAGEISKESVLGAFELCAKINYCKNINDIIHLKLAEIHTSKIVTFDRDFEKLKAYSHIDIDIL